MTVLFSRKCEYALQALLYLAEFEADGTLSADRIAQQLDIPKEFISKILQSLTKRNIVISQRGKTGGFKLAKAPEKISLLDVVATIDGLGIFEDCLIGQPACSGDSPCPVHHTWAGLRRQLQSLLTQTNLSNFIPGQSLADVAESLAN